MTKKQKISEMLSAYARSLGGINNSKDALHMCIHQDGIINKINNTWRKETIDSAYVEFKNDNLNRFTKILNWSGYHY